MIGRVAMERLGGLAVVKLVGRADDKNDLPRFFFLTRNK